MADENIITFNVTNWITVLVIVGVGFFAIGYLQKLYASRKTVS